MTSLLAGAGATLVRRPLRARSSGGASRGRTLLRILPLLAAVTVVASLGTAEARAVAGLFGLLAFVVVAFKDRGLAVASMVAWVVVLGFVRRFLIPFAGWSPNDPLLLVSPVAALVLLAATRPQTPPPRSLLLHVVAFQLLWVTAGIANPGEHDLLVTLESAAFVVIPLLWFFVGRRLSADENDRLVAALHWLLVPVVALGLWQTLHGPLPFELRWLSIVNNPFLFVGGFHVRPFSTFASPAEYGLFLDLAGVALWVAFLHGERRGIGWKVLFGATVVALFLQSSRGVFVAFLVAVLVVTAARWRATVAALIGIAVVAVVVSPLGFGIRQPRSEPAMAYRPLGTPVGRLVSAPATPQRQTTASALFEHEVSGLLNPGQSTAPIHFDQYLRGLRLGFENPLGLGVSSFSLAHSRTLEAEPAQQPLTPESQLPNTAASLGIPAAIALLLVYVLGFVGAWRLYRAEPSARHLAWLGILLAVGDQALNGSLYATSVIAGLVYGAISVEWVGLHRRRLPARVHPAHAPA